jgi:hypothetical protein
MCNYSHEPRFGKLTPLLHTYTRIFRPSRRSADLQRSFRLRITLGQQAFPRILPETCQLRSFPPIQSSAGCPATGPLLPSFPGCPNQKKMRCCPVSSLCIQHLPHPLRLAACAKRMLQLPYIDTTKTTQILKSRANIPPLSSPQHARENKYS